MEHGGDVVGQRRRLYAHGTATQDDLGRPIDDLDHVGGAPQTAACDQYRHPEQKERQAAGNAAYWDSFWDADQVFYGHVLGFKGLGRCAVVLVVNEESAFERSRERLYVGLSRARDQLVVCGDPDFIRDVGGPISPAV